MTRPKLALIVEGDGEYVGLPNLVRKRFSFPYTPLPTVNAGGIGNILANVEQLLIDLIRLDHPESVIITLDSADALVLKRYHNCVQVRRELDQRVAACMTAQQINTNLHPLPAAITIVLQTPVFESWLSADDESLVRSNLTAPGFTPATYVNVDVEISNHRAHLNSCLRMGYKKRPAEVARITKALNPLALSLHSRSFRKFWGEVELSFLR